METSYAFAPCNSSCSKTDNMDGLSASKKPHAVCLPYPTQGHINPMFKLAKLLHHKGFHVTFVNTEYNHRRLLNSRGSSSLDGVPGFRFETIPDGLPPVDADATQDIPLLCQSVARNCLVPFRQLLAKLDATPDVPPVTCIVSDAIMSFSATAAEELGLPVVLFWTTSACGFLGYAHYKHLVEKGLVPFKDKSDLTNGYLETTIDWIPKMKDIRLRDIPSFIRTTDRDDIMLNFFLGQVKGVSKATAIVMNTFEALEQEYLAALSSMFPPIYAVGPLPLLLEQIQQDELAAIGSNLWKEEPGCLSWLDSKEPNSVVFVNFGSITVMTSKQLVEFAWGLANSKHTFLWIVRPDLVAGDFAMLPAEFLEETKERGLLASWCPQEQILNHPSLGGFLSHMGWNSTCESLCGGVPMLCWPFFAEQQTNCRFACTEWGIGMEIDNQADRYEIEKLVRELMEGEKGKEMKQKAAEWKKKAHESTLPSGTSSINFNRLIDEVLLAQKR